jgi:sec-independent protein translocase protein TatB
MSAELLLILLVALLAFKPKNLPMLVSHLAKAWRWYTKRKEQWQAFLEQQVRLQTLKENQQKAAKAEEEYRA